MSDQYVGEIRLFAGNFAPFGWASCSGQLLSIAENQALFALIGTTYGGDGQNTFGVPDLRGRAIMHQGAGPGLSDYVLGQPVGVETVTLTGQQISHTHPMYATVATGSTGTPGTSVILASPGNDFPIYNGTATPVSLANQAVSAQGGGQPHENRQPYLAMTYIIALDGIFPSQN
jgi:microcystin-dependent protein